MYYWGKHLHQSRLNFYNETICCFTQGSRIMTYSCNSDFPYSLKYQPHLPFPYTLFFGAYTLGIGIPFNNRTVILHVYVDCLMGTPTKRQVSKRPVSKRPVSKRLVSKRPVFKYDILIKPKKYLYLSFLHITNHYGDIWQKEVGSHGDKFKKKHKYSGARLVLIEGCLYVW